MTFDLKSLLSPPSLLFPIIGAGVGYLLGKEEGENAPMPGWAILAGALGGALFNASSKIVDLKSEAAKSSGVTEFKGNVGGEAVSSIIGATDSVIPATQPSPQAVTGPSFGIYAQHTGAAISAFPRRVINPFCIPGR